MIPATDNAIPSTPPLYTPDDDDADSLERIALELAKLNANITRLGVLHADGINRIVAALGKLTHGVDAVAVAVEAAT